MEGFFEIVLVFGWQALLSILIRGCSLLAELCGLFYGLRLALESGCKRVLVECDSQVVIDWLCHGVREDHPYYGLLMSCRKFCAEDWEVKVSHMLLLIWAMTSIWGSMF